MRGVPQQAQSDDDGVSLKASWQEELREFIAANPGGVSPRGVVEQARRTPGSALYEYVFDRSDEEAVEAWWIERAKRALREIKVVYRDDSDPTTRPKMVRLTCSLREDRGGDQSYKAVPLVLGDDSLRARLLDQARREAERLREKYEDLRGFEPDFFEALDLFIG